MDGQKDEEIVEIIGNACAGGQIIISNILANI